MADRPAFTHRPPKHGLIGPFSARQVVLALVSVVVAIVVLVAVTTPLGSTGVGPPPPAASQYLVAAPTEGLRVGSGAPELRVPDGAGGTFQLSDLDGRPISLAALRGKIVWLNFWASWCPPCQQETPILREMYDSYRGRGLVVVAVEVQETIDDGRRYAERYGLHYTIGADVSGKVFHAYRVYGLPTQFFIGPDGVIRSVVQGPMTEAGAVANIESLLASSSPAPSSGTAVP